MNSFDSHYNVKLPWQDGWPASTVTGTATAIVKATYERQMELYYPHLKKFYLLKFLRTLFPRSFEALFEMNMSE